MKLRLLRSAIEDLADGRSFYDLQQPRLLSFVFWTAGAIHAESPTN